MEENTFEKEKLVREISQPLKNATGWMRFLGIAMIVYGILIALSIVGIVIAWLPIWLGVLMTRSANRANEAYYQGNQFALTESLRNLGSYFTINGVMLLISIIFILVLVIVLFSTGLLLENLDQLEHFSI